MKIRHAVLILTDTRYQAVWWRQAIDRQSFFPGSRLKNYLESLAGFAVPYDIIDVAAFPAAVLSEGDRWRYTETALALRIGAAAVEGCLTGDGRPLAARQDAEVTLVGVPMTAAADGKVALTITPTTLPTTWSAS